MREMEIRMINWGLRVCYAASDNKSVGRLNTDHCWRNPDLLRHCVAMTNSWINQNLKSPRFPRAFGILFDFILQSEIVCNHCDKFRICRLSATVLYGISKI